MACLLLNYLLQMKMTLSHRLNQYYLQIDRVFGLNGSQQHEQESHKLYLKVYLQCLEECRGTVSFILRTQHLGYQMFHCHLCFLQYFHLSYLHFLPILNQKKNLNLMWMGVSSPKQLWQQQLEYRNQCVKVTLQMKKTIPQNFHLQVHLYLSFLLKCRVSALNVLQLPRQGMNMSYCWAFQQYLGHCMDRGKSTQDSKH